MSFIPWTNLEPPTEMTADDRTGYCYAPDDDLRFAAEAALITGRPLLIRGEPGCGKSSFAPFLARNLDWRYYEYNVTGRTSAKDLLWSFDALNRLRLAQAGEEDEEKLAARNFVTPGPIWWAFNRKLAHEFVDAKHEPNQATNKDRDKTRSVVLVDEIDKADLNVPNDLLEVIGLNRFTVDELQQTVELTAAKPATDANGENKDAQDKQIKKWNSFGNLLLVITTNQERDLPTAFERRCITHSLVMPKDNDALRKILIAVAKLHFKKQDELTEFKKGGLYYDIANRMAELRQEAEAQFVRGPSIAEFLDALRVARELGKAQTDKSWKRIVRGILVKASEWQPPVQE